MKQRDIFMFFYQVLTGAVCAVLTNALNYAAHPVENVLIITLGLTCLLGFQLLLTLFDKLPWLRLSLLAAAFITAICFDRGMYPFCCLLLACVCGRIEADRKTSVTLFAVLVFLFGLVLSPDEWAVLVTLLVTAPVLFIDYATGRSALIEARAEAERDENNNLRRQLSDERRTNQYSERAARLSERNRLAAHIHDRVGHGISGSILLLEGARLSMEKNPEKAGAAIATATENLRATVDDIRASLRQERAAPGEAGLTRIAEALTAFKAQHPGIFTELTTDGDLMDIPPQVWVCIEENLTDTLTNLLKHSTADFFQVSVVMRNKLVTASFRDNGAVKDFTPGVGLTAMEERCALCRGNCFFSAGPDGFSTVMTFTHRGGHS